MSLDYKNDGRSKKLVPKVIIYDTDMDEGKLSQMKC